MIPGKIPESVLKRSVLKLLKSNKEAVISGPAVGEDCGLLELENLCAFSMDPVTGSVEEAGYRAVHVAANNLVATGAEPVAVMTSVLLPETVKEKELKQLIRDMERASDELHISSIGGHTETTKAVNKPIITVTAIGRILEKPLMTGGAKPDQDIVMTKYAGLEGTGVIAMEKELELEERFSKDYVEQAKQSRWNISVSKEAELSRKFGVSAMHDVRKGGIFGALWELTSAAGVGMKVVLEDIPVMQETIEICELYDLNPYKLISGGSMIIVTERGHDLVKCLEEAGIKATVIGKTTESQSRIVVREQEEGFLEPPKSDEICQVL